MILARNFAPGFRVRLHIKDLKNAMDTAHHLGVPPPLSSLVLEFMHALAAGGKGERDHGGLVQFYERLAKAEVRGSWPERPSAERSGVFCLQNGRQRAPAQPASRVRDPERPCAARSGQARLAATISWMKALSGRAPSIAIFSLMTVLGTPITRYFWPRWGNSETSTASARIQSLSSAA